jgi:hypothetical protein
MLMGLKKISGDSMQAGHSKIIKGKDKVIVDKKCLLTSFHSVMNGSA